MKKIMIICLTALAMTSCQKEEVLVKKEKPIIYKTAYFTGTPSVNAELKINGISTIDGVKYGLNQPIKVKVGDIISFTDLGVDFIIEPEITFWNLDGTISYHKPAVIEQGFISCAILVDNLVVKNAQGQNDIWLSYKVQ